MRTRLLACARRLHPRDARLIRRSSRAPIRAHCSSLPAPGRRLHYASSGQLGSARLALCSTQLTITGSITSPSFRSKRLQAGYRPPAHCLSAIAVCCSLASLARHQTVVAVVAGPARPSGRAVATAPRPSPLRGWPTSALPLAHIPAGATSRSSRPGRLGLPPSRPRVRPYGRRPRFRSGEGMFARCRGLPSLSLRTVQRPCSGDSVGNPPAAPYVYLRPCSAGPA